MTDKLTEKEINKICHSIVTGGEGCWEHEWEETDILAEVFYHPSGRGELYCQKCSKCDLIISPKDVGFMFPNPDYLKNPTDYTRFLFFVVNEWEGEKRMAFLLSHHASFYLPPDEPAGVTDYSIPRHLLKDQRTLPTAIAEWMGQVKEGG